MIQPPDEAPHPAWTSTHRWLMDVIIGLNLCPFARPALPGTDIEVLLSQDRDDLLRQVLAHAHALAAVPLEEPATTLLVLPDQVDAWEDYLDLLDQIDAVWEAADLHGVVQVISFHPDYQFEGEDPDDPAVLTNRSPHPLLHLVREEEMSEVIDRHPDTEQIPVRNARRLRALSQEELRRLFPWVARS